MLIIICMLVVVFNIVILEILQLERSDAVPDNGTVARSCGSGWNRKLYAAGTGYAELQADPCMILTVI